MYYKMWKNKFVAELNIDLTSPYHLEGSNLTHTLMVYNEICHSNHNTMTMKLTGLLHDIGKRKALKIIDEKKITQGHEGISTYMAVNYLKELVAMDIISFKEMLDILFIINHHGDLMKYKDSKKYWKLWRYETDKLTWIKIFNLYDILGRISNKIYAQPTIEVEKSERKIIEDEEKPVVYFMIGVPGVGKSTFVEKQNLDVVSRDSILLEYGKEKYGLKEYSEIWDRLSDEEQKEIDRLLDEKIKSLQEQRKDFIIDMTLVSVKSRKRMLNKIKKDYQVVYINVLADYEEIMKRNEQRCRETGKCISEKVILEMMKNYQIPLYGEDDRIIDIQFLIN